MGAGAARNCCNSACDQAGHASASSSTAPPCEAIGAAPPWEYIPDSAHEAQEEWPDRCLPVETAMHADAVGERRCEAPSSLKGEWSGEWSGVLPVVQPVRCLESPISGGDEWSGVLPVAQPVRCLESPTSRDSRTAVDAGVPQLQRTAAAQLSEHVPVLGRNEYMLILTTVEGDELGLELEVDQKEGALTIIAIHRGLVQEWNAQNIDRRVCLGDAIVQVNNVRWSARDMLLELRDPRSQPKDPAGKPGGKHLTHALIMKRRRQGSPLAAMAKGVLAPQQPRSRQP